MLSVAAVYAIREATENLKGLEFNASKIFVDRALNYSYHTIVLFATIA